MKLRLILWLLVGVVLAITSYTLSLRAPTVTNQPGSGTAHIGGDFTLTSHEGKTVSTKDYRGRYMLVFFGFTQCPDVCPLTLGVLSQLLAAMGDNANSIVPLFITVDPTTDTPSVLAEFLKAFPSRFIGLTGSEAEINAVTEQFKVYVNRAPLAETTGITHADYVFVMGKEGEYVTHFRADIGVDAITKKLEEAMSAH